MNAEGDMRAIPAYRVLAAFLGLALCAASARAQITSPVDLGSNQADGTTSTSLTVITTANAPAGGSIIVTAATSTDFGPQATGATCSDSAGNTYTTDVTQTLGTSNLTSICSTHSLAAQLSAGATITVSWTGTVPNGQTYLVHAYAVTGLASAALDKTATTAGTGSSVSTGATATTAQANELLFAAFLDTGSRVSNAGFVPGTNGTANDCAGSPTYTSLGGVDSGNPPALFGAFCIVSATGAYSANAVLVGNPFWQAALATYKAAALQPPTIAKAFGATSITQGGTTSLTFNLSNSNRTSALTGVAFTDSLPAGLVVATPNALTGSCGGGLITATAGTGSVSLSGATLPGGGSCSFSVNVTATSIGTMNNSTGPVTSTNGGSGAAGTASLAVSAPIPTLGSLGLLLLGLVLGALAVTRLRLSTVTRLRL